MPLIYGTDELKTMADRLILRYPDRDVILLKNSVMVYAFGVSARHIYRVDYPGQKPRDRVNVAAADIEQRIDRLVAHGLSVALCDLDAPLRDYAGRNPDEKMTLCDGNA